jgi:hypothetical protein
MSLKERALIYLIAILLSAGIVFIIVKQTDLAKQQKAIQDQNVATQQLANNVIRAQDSYATKADIASLATANDVNLKTIQDNLNGLGAKVDGINVVSVSTIGQNVTNAKSTGTDTNVDAGPPPSIICDGKSVACPDPYGYAKTAPELKLNEDVSDGGVPIPIGQVSFSSWSPTPWDYQVYPRKYTVVTVIGKDANDRDYVYNKMMIDSDGKTYAVPIDSSRFEQQVPAASWSFWNPRLYMGISGGLALPAHNFDVVPSLAVSLMSYGESKTTPDWTFLDVGIGYAVVNRNLALLVTPVSYNIGQHFPLMKNLYLGPTLGFDTGANWLFLGTLTVGL